MSRPLVLGHIDHGKTSLVRALTGIDTDAVFDRSGAHVATAGDDGRAIIWAATPHEQVTWLGRARRADLGRAILA